MFLKNNSQINASVLTCFVSEDRCKSVSDETPGDLLSCPQNEQLYVGFEDFDPLIESMFSLLSIPKSPSFVNLQLDTFQLMLTVCSEISFNVVF